MILLHVVEGYVSEIKMTGWRIKWKMNERIYLINEWTDGKAHKQLQSSYMHTAGHKDSCDDVGFSKDCDKTEKQEARTRYEDAWSCWPPMAEDVLITNKEGGEYLNVLKRFAKRIVKITKYLYQENLHADDICIFFNLSN